MVKYLLVILLLAGCQTVPSAIVEPPDLKPVIQEIDSLKELDSKPEIKARIIEKIQQSSDYSQACYSKTLELEQRLNDLETKLNEKDQRIAELEEELSTWRSIKIAFAALLMTIIVISVVFAVLKLRKFFGSPE